MPVLRVMRSRRHVYSGRADISLCSSTALPSPPPKAAEERRRAGSGRRRKARCQGTAGRGLLSAVNIFQKWCFVPQTSCLQQHGLIQALCANTSVALDHPLHPATLSHLSTGTHTHTHHKHTHFLPTEDPHNPPHPHHPPSSFSSSIEVNYQNCVWKWMKGDLLSLSPLSLSLFLSLSPFLLWHLSFFFFFLTCYRFWARW